MKTMIRTLALAALAAALTPPARAALPEEGWWRLDGEALGMHVEGDSFCGIAAKQGSVWLLRGRVVDGRLVQQSRSAIRGPAAAPSRDGRLQQALRQSADPTDYFVLPTSLVSRERTAEQPRGEFAVFEPLTVAPSSTLWLDMVWGCSKEVEVEKVAEALQDQARED